MEKINIAELLKDCPKGMELDSPVWDNIVFKEIDGNNIVISRKSVDSKVYLTQYGELNSIDGKCVIFPKGKTTWEGFVSPYQFKDGDIIYNQFIQAVAIFCKQTDRATVSHCFLNVFKDFKIGHYHSKFLADWRLATEEEKQKLFDAIEMNGYKWNSETKTLDKLPKFKVGDKVKHIPTSTLGIVVKADDKGYYIDNHNVKGICYISFTLEKDYELIPNKFDINTLKPFDKVLFRMHDKDTWCNGFYSFYKNNQHVVNSLTITKQCIPYKGNEYLLNTTDDCSEYYKTWK